MTPEEKAKELIKRFIDKFRETDTCFSEECKNSISCQHSWYSCEGWLKSAKQSAIIAVEEIFEFMKQDDLDSGTASNANSKWVQYYNEVLNHLKIQL